MTPLRPCPCAPPPASGSPRTCLSSCSPHSFPGVPVFSSFPSRFRSPRGRSNGLSVGLSIWPRSRKTCMAVPCVPLPWHACFHVLGRCQGGWLQDASCPFAVRAPDTLLLLTCAQHPSVRPLSPGRRQPLPEFPGPVAMLCPVSVMARTCDSRWEELTPPAQGQRYERSASWFPSPQPGPRPHSKPLHSLVPFPTLLFSFPPYFPLNILLDRFAAGIHS